MTRHTRRRFVYSIFGGLGAIFAGSWIFRRSIVKQLFGYNTYNPDISISPAPVANDMCVLTAHQAEGPFYFLSPERSNIIEDRDGMEMRLRLQVVRHPDCTPVEGALVDIWHCDANGNYSGYPETLSRDAWKEFVLFTKHSERMPSGEMHVNPLTEARYLRGLQRTDADGWVEFTTIFPGWYESRVPHIHAKVILSPEEQATTQFYFDEDFQNGIYASVKPYDKHGPAPVTIFNDQVIGTSGSNQLAGLMLKPSHHGSMLSCSGRIGIRQA